MNIIRTNVNADSKKELYRITKSASAQFQSVEPGTRLEIDKYAIYEDDYKQRDGSTGTRPVLSVTTRDGQKFSSISPTVIRSFGEILDIMDGEEFAIIITGGTSKGGRKYIDCELDCE